MNLERKTITGIFKIRSTKTLYYIKQYKPLQTYLVQNKTFISSSKWGKESTIIIRWLYKALPDYHRQDDLAKEISTVTNTSPDNFTLVPARNTITSPKGTRIIYNSLKVECTKKTANEVQEAITTALLEN